MTSNSRPPLRLSDARGIALVVVMLLLLLTSSILAAFLTTTMTDQRLRAVDRSRTQAFYAAHAGLEKLTSDLGNLFATDFAPEPADLEAIAAAPPELENVTFAAADGLGYAVDFVPDADGNPAATSGTIASGPYQGFVGLATPYTLTVTSRLVDGSEARLRRTLQTVSIPVFQFGIFSETDLTFSANGTFTFGGRVHTNGNLWLSAATGGALYLSEKVTAVNEVVRTNLANDRATSAAHNGLVRVAKSSGCSPTAISNCRPLTPAEGSLVGHKGSAMNEPKWTNLSLGDYNAYIRNGRTGARRLELPLTELGATPSDLIRRPTPGENPLITDQRLFTQAGVRILLSDSAAAITDMPGVTAAGPLALGRLADTPIAGYAVDADHAPLAVAGAAGYLVPANTPLHGGVIKVEYRDAGDTWHDVTLEMLNLGFTRRNTDSAGCAAEPSPDAIIRIQRVKAAPSSGAPCAVDSTVDTDYWPLVLYDTREGWVRDNTATSSTAIYLGGVMHYVDLDVNNLRRWLAGEIGASGTNVVNEDGFVVFFSDRRTNRDPLGDETGEYGNEDFVNPNDAASAAPNGTLDLGEDVNGSDTLETYGATPVVEAGAAAPMDGTATPRTAVTSAQARANRAIFFRRALKLTNGALGNLPTDGLTVVSENPVYVQGHYNADADGFGDPHAPAAIMADAITLLSAAWTDAVSFSAPHSPGGRAAISTAYRFAALPGKGPAFPHFGTQPNSYGTDGGVHNLLRLLEGWGNDTLSYRGSLASFYFNRQAVGPFRCCNNVYQLPDVRAFAFDTDFLMPSLLPPKTPMFRDINTTGFVQVTRRQ